MYGGTDMDEIELNEYIDQISQKLNETRQKLRKIFDKGDNTVEELLELGELLAEEKALESKLRDALNAKFFRGGRKL